MFSVDDINEMQKTIERKDRIIKVLKERVRQWVKEYNILDAIIDLKDEDIAVLEAYKDVNEDFKTAWEELKGENAKLKEENEKLNKMTGVFSARLCKKYRTTLQEIKAMCEKHIRAEKIVMAQEVIDLITKVEEE